MLISSRLPFLTMLALASALPLTAAQAADVAPFPAPVPAETSWLVTVNAQAFLSPRYIGAKTYSVIGFPTLSFRRAGTPQIWSSPDDSVNYAVVETPRFSFGPVIAYRGGRYADAGHELYGVHKSRWTLEPGLYGDFWVVPDMLRLHAEIRRGFRKEDGFVGSLGADFVGRYDRFTFGIGPRIKLGNDHFVDRQFGITANDALVNGNYQPFKAQGGIYAVGAYGSVVYKQSEEWSYTLHGGYDRLTQDASRSPITRTTGSRNQYTLGASVAYTFGWTGWTPSWR
jgi:outer membrane protein